MCRESRNFGRFVAFSFGDLPFFSRKVHVLNCPMVFTNSDGQQVITGHLNNTGMTVYVCVSGYLRSPGPVVPKLTIKASGEGLIALIAINNHTVQQCIQFFNKATLPEDSDVPRISLSLAVDGGGFLLDRTMWGEWACLP